MYDLFLLRFQTRCREIWFYSFISFIAIFIMEGGLREAWMCVKIATMALAPLKTPPWP